MYVLDEQVPETIRLHLGGSIAIVDRHRTLVTEKLRTRLAVFEQPGEDFGRAEVTGVMLTDLLIEEARHIAATGRVGRLAAVVREHRRLGMRGVDYSRYGSDLGAVLREVLGPRLPPRMISAWVNAYWFVIRQLGVQEAAGQPGSDADPRRGHARPAMPPTAGSAARSGGSRR